MACNDYEWTPTTHDDVLKVVIWFQNKFDLRDWAVTVDTAEAPPGRFKDEDNGSQVCARCEMVLRYHSALMWLPLARLEKFNVNAIQSAMHEMLHIFCDARRVETDDETNDNPIECLIIGLESAVYQLYCWEHKVKIPKLRTDVWTKVSL